MSTRIVVVGGGYVGMYTAQRLQGRLSAADAEITVIDPQPNMTYQPFLPEATAGNIEPRHVVVPLRTVLRRCRVLTAEVTSISHRNRVLTVRPPNGETYDVEYDLAVICPGSVSRVVPMPGLRETALEFKTIADAIRLRNHVLGRLDIAASNPDPDARRRALTFVFVGGGYAGVEAIAELEDMTRHAIGFIPTIAPTDTRWVLIDSAERIMPELSPAMARYTAARLAERGIDVRLATTLRSIDGGYVETSDGDRFAADTVVWTAGVRANPLLLQTDLPLDAAGRIICRADLTVVGVDGAFAAGDCAAVPDLTSPVPGATCSPSAQHALRQAKTLADNVVAAIHGRKLRPYRHAHAGSVASLGLYRGVAEIYGIKLRGPIAWLLHRAYHLSRMPTPNRKIRVLADWLLALALGREVVSLGPPGPTSHAMQPTAVQRTDERLVSGNN